MNKLKGEERRNKIIELLRASDQPVSGSSLAKELGVSRQVIVTDIALIRANNPEVISTPVGYTMASTSATRRIFKVKHPEDRTEDELVGIVDLGGFILDVFVEHRAYGTIRVPLDIGSKRDVNNFMSDLRSGVSSPLSRITDGYHYHTIEARSNVILDEIEEMLRQKGYLIESLTNQPVYSPKRYQEL